tara:strand:- start:2770 stop:3270 length:501 start_codon:yes stop_codon:yes gene_type:complete
MPTDPKTGKRLPYAGEPGAPEGAPPAPEEGGGKAAALNEESERLGDIINQLDSALGSDAEGEPAEGEATEGAPEETESQDLSVLVETLGLSPERAEMLYQAAQQLASTQGKSPEELAKIVADDFNILMQLEVIAARSMKNQPEEPAAPAGPEAAGMPPEMMPPGGM